MANLIRRNEGNRELSAPRTTSEWDPFRMMREMLRWDPLRDVEGGSLWERGFTPSFEVTESNDAYVFRADLPGVKEEDVEISLTGNRLTISGHREQERQEQNQQYHTAERTYGSFTRSFTLPEGTDQEHVQADMKSGVLTVNVPKRPEVQPRRVAISGRAEGGTGQKAKA
jgi:HSP20 family protein